MEIDLSIGEIWDLLREGSRNQREFINSLRYSEFEEFLEECEYIFEEYDLRGLLNGGCLFVEETPEDEEENEENEEICIIYRNDRITIYLY